MLLSAEMTAWWGVALLLLRLLPACTDDAGALDFLGGCRGAALCMSLLQGQKTLMNLLFGCTSASPLRIAHMVEG